MKFTGGQHQFVVSTHVDKSHVHSHIEFDSTNLNCDEKFVNVKNSYLVLRRLNDELCRTHGLSVIEEPWQRAKQPGEAAQSNMVPVGRSVCARPLTGCFLIAGAMRIFWQNEDRGMSSKRASSCPSVPPDRSVSPVPTVSPIPRRPCGAQHHPARVLCGGKKARPTHRPEDQSSDRHSSEDSGRAGGADAKTESKPLNASPLMPMQA